MKILSLFGKKQSLSLLLIAGLSASFGVPLYGQQAADAQEKLNRLEQGYKKLKKGMRCVFGKESCTRQEWAEIAGAAVGLAAIVGAAGYGAYRWRQGRAAEQPPAPDERPAGMAGPALTLSQIARNEQIKRTQERLKKIESAMQPQVAPAKAIQPLAQEGAQEPVLPAKPPLKAEQQAPEEYVPTLFDQAEREAERKHKKIASTNNEEAAGEFFASLEGESAKEGSAPREKVRKAVEDVIRKQRVQRALNESKIRYIQSKEKVAQLQKVLMDQEKVLASVLARPQTERNKLLAGQLKGQILKIKREIKALPASSSALKPQTLKLTTDQQRIMRSIISRIELQISQIRSDSKKLVELYGYLLEFKEPGYKYPEIAVDLQEYVIKRINQFEPTNIDLLRAPYDEIKMAYDEAKKYVESKPMPQQQSLKAEGLVKRKVITTIEKAMEKWQKGKKYFGV